jgi:hypothetical protein
MAQIKAKGWKPNVASTLKTKVATYEHPEHGIVTVRHNPANRRFEVMHAGKMAGLKGQKGSFGDAKAALEHAHNYMSSVSAGTTAGHRMYNVSSDKVVPPKIQKSQQQAGARIPTSRNETNEPMKPIKKAMEAGSGMAAPGNLVGGAALAKEDKLNKPVFSTTKGKDLRSGLPGLKSGAGTSYMGAHVRQGNMERAKDIAKKTLKDKSKWLARAEEEYKNWQKREQFEDFMSKKMPHLTKGEVQAIGQCLALSKAMKLEKSLSRMSPDYSGDYKAQSYVNKAEDELLKGFVLMASEGSREEMKKFSDQLMATEEGRALKKLFPF